MVDIVHNSIYMALGHVAGHTVGNKAGRNASMALNSFADIWSQGGTFVPPTQARIHAVASSSTSDTAAGVGARTVAVTGLDANYDEFTETVTLNGTTPVNMVTPAIFIQRTRVATAGSHASGTNVGNITFTAATDATVTHHMQAGYGQGANAIYLVPAGNTMLLKQYGGGMQGGSGLDLQLMTRPLGGAWQVRGNLPLNLNGQTVDKREYPNFLSIPEKTLVKIRGYASSNNTDATAYFDYILKDN